ncbi:MAG: sigma-70 family RNA polymerase sigma factor [Planctomycetes bacterium]|nr:sigma-70 family RNA polymerase sigma factor [Planctomycetota bacterium]
MPDSRKNCESESPEVVERLRREGEEGLAAIFQEHRPRLLRMVEARMDPRLRGRVDASDIVQEAYQDASRRLPEFLSRPDMRLFLWLRLLVGQRLFAAYRWHVQAQKRDARREVDCAPAARPEASSASLSFLLAADVTSPSDAAARLETRERLRQRLEELDPLDREILSLRHFEDLSNDEAAAELGISKAAASKRYVRALERLREILGPSE